VSGRRLLIVDDDEMLRQVIKEQLYALGDFASISEADSGASALKILENQHFDLVLLAGHLPDMEGGDVCRKMRAQSLRSPIIILAGADTETETIVNAESGANDYVIKPFRMAVLFARVRTHLRQHEQSDDAILVIGPYKFRPAAKVLSNDKSDEKVRLTEKETAILEYLYRVGNKTVARETLLDEVWGYNASVTTHTLETHVYRLRKKIEPDPSHVRILITEPGGYRLNS